MLERDDRVGGQYRIDRLLGRGATSIVYLAFDERLGRSVAVKVLHAGAAADAEALARFEREGRNQAQLDHPAVLPILDTGQTDSGPYLVTRFVDGANLRQLLRRGELPLDRVLRIVQQVAEALDFAHLQGLVHRDVKPSNILIDDDDRAYLADFGLARSVTSETVTRTGQVFGTLAYLAPEVILGEQAAPASDRYAFAATLYEAIVGQVPFPRPTDAAVLFAHGSAPRPSPRAVRPELPARLTQVFAEALAIDPGRRLGSCAALVDLVRETIGGDAARQLGSPTVLSSTQGSSSLSPGLSSGPNSPYGLLRGRFSRSSGRAKAALGVVAVLMIVAVASAVASISPMDRAAVTVPATSAGEVSAGALTVDPVATVGCDGAPPAATSSTCTLVQLDGAGSPVVVEEDGVITRWHVKGVDGTVRLQVLSGDLDAPYAYVETLPVEVDDDGIVTVPANLDVRAGDRLGLVVVAGSGVGVAPSGAGSLARWVGPVVFWQPGKHVAGEIGVPGLDGALQLRVDIAPGRAPDQLRVSTGSVASADRPSQVVASKLHELDGQLYDVQLAVYREGLFEMYLVLDGVRQYVLSTAGSLGFAEPTRFEVIDTPDGTIATVEWDDSLLRRRTRIQVTISPDGFRVINS